MATDYKSILNNVALRQLAQSWLTEDQPAFDLQSLAFDNEGAVASICCKSKLAILAGVPFVDAVAKEVDVSLDWSVKEGQAINRTIEPVKVCELQGTSANILRMERVSLNILARCSGIATLTHEIRNRLDAVGWNGVLAGTRKTTPGFRLPEKYSLVIGGASTHRYDMSHMIMLKDNHVSLAGSITRAIERVRAIRDFTTKIEVECGNRPDALTALDMGVDIIMLDNFSSPELKLLSQELRERDPGKRTLIEASGGITANNVTDYALPSVDIISMSCLVQGYPAVDFSMNVRPQ